MRTTGRPERISSAEAEAEARLRYVRDVRRRTQRSAPSPLLLVGVLGALVIVRGVLLLCWPHVAGLSAAWFIGVSLGGLAAALWLEDRQRTRTGIQLGRGFRPAVLALTLAGELIAHAVGANVIIAAIGVPIALAEWRSGIRTTAVVTVTIGLISEALVLQGTHQWAALMIFGAGLMATCVTGRRDAERAR